MYGACGAIHNDADLIVSLDIAIYDNGAYCGKQVAITNVNNSVSITVTVADECPLCDGPYSVDLSRGAFMALSGGSLFPELLDGTPSFLLPNCRFITEMKIAVSWSFLD